MAWKVLIAEDEPNILTSLEFLLRADGYDVRTARDGGEALRLAQAYLPDLVLLDAMMPVRSGLEVCQGIREDASLRDTRILMLSARGRVAEIDRGLAHGADAYVTKPFSTRELLERVRELLPVAR